MGVSKLVESGLSWTLIIVPSFCTLRQIHTGDNFGGVERSSDDSNRERPSGVSRRVFLYHYKLVFELADIF